MKIAVPRERYKGEKRVAITPQVAAKLMKIGFEVEIENGAGAEASFSDDSYRAVGVSVVDDVEVLWRDADVILKVRAPEEGRDSGINELSMLKPEHLLISFVWPSQNDRLLQQFEDSGATVLAMDSVPRISRAQKMDALSSMANIAGYRAIVEASQHFGRFFTGQITAAGKIPPAKVLVIGAGVAGLAAIGAAKSMGAIVRAFDTRPEVKEQVESMDAEFLMVDIEEEGAGVGGYAKTMSEEFIKAEMELFGEQAKDVDIIVTTALIPGKPAPRLITKEMVSSMVDGSVIVDLAAEQGGNCELTEPGKVVERGGVKIIGYTDLPSRLAAQSSQLYATNQFHLIDEMTKENDGLVEVDMENEVIRGATVALRGEITWPPPAPKLTAAPNKKIDQGAATLVEEPAAKENRYADLIVLAIGACCLWLLGKVAPPDFMSHLTVFVLACFVGYQVIWNVTPALHTPLMSVTNAISGIIVIGALLKISSTSFLIMTLAGIATFIATINIAGGFLVTQRMLKMFRK